MEVILVGVQSVGRAVTSDTRDPQFKSSHQEIWFTLQSTVIKTVLKRQKLRKRDREWLIFYKNDENS